MENQSIQNDLTSGGILLGISGGEGLPGLAEDDPMRKRFFEGKLHDNTPPSVKMSDSMVRGIGDFLGTGYSNPAPWENQSTRRN